MTSYPNREHEAADRAAMRRALAALSAIIGEANDLHWRLSQDQRVDADDARTLDGKVHDLTGFLGELSTLRDVREWHAADQASLGVPPWQPQTLLRFQCHGCGLKLMDSEVEDHKQRHGLVTQIVNDLGGQDPHPRHGADQNDIDRETP